MSHAIRAIIGKADMKEFAMLDLDQHRKM